MDYFGGRRQGVKTETKTSRVTSTQEAGGGHRRTGELSQSRTLHQNKQANNKETGKRLIPTTRGSKDSRRLAHQREFGAQEQEAEILVEANTRGLCKADER